MLEVIDRPLRQLPRQYLGEWGVLQGVYVSKVRLERVLNDCLREYTTRRVRLLSMEAGEAWVTLSAVDRTKVLAAPLGKIRLGPYPVDDTTTARDIVEWIKAVAAFGGLDQGQENDT